MKLKEQAKIQGHQEGIAAGVAEGKAAGQKAGEQQALAAHNAALTELVKALTGISAQMNASRHQLEEEAGNAVVQLAVSIARKVTKLDPSQRQTLLDALPALKMQWPSLAHVEIVDDPTLAPGGCRIRTRGGLIDADLDRQIDQIAHDLLPEANTEKP